MLMMLLGLKIFVTGITLYGGVRLTCVGIQWMREFFDKLSPKQRDD